MTTCIDLFYSYIDGLLEILIEFIFLNQYLGKRGTPGQLIIYILTGSVLVSLPLPILPKLILFATLLFLYIIRIQKRRITSAVVFAVLTITVMQLSYGILNSVSTVLASLLYRFQLPLPGRLFMIIASLLSLTLAILCYLFIDTYRKLQQNEHNRQMILTLVPLLTIFSISNYISFTFYGNTASQEPISILLLKSHSQIFLIQLLSIVSLFSILCLCQKLAETGSLHERLTLLTRQFYIQKQYMEKAQAHYNDTKALRHDMKNHILIVKGLLERENLERARVYLEEMDTASARLSFSFHTGSPILDILLENKMALARNKGISVTSAIGPFLPCSIDDMDFCSILSNALDNAIHACEKLNKNQKKYIHIEACRQENLLLLEISNSCHPKTHFHYGIGLSNIRRTAEKYAGTIKIHTEGTIFHLNILLFIPQHAEHISNQTD